MDHWLILRRAGEKAKRLLNQSPATDRAAEGAGAFMESKMLPASEALGPASELILRGETVAIPTETVYGLAADAGNGEALAKIFAVKERPRFNPLIVHVAGIAMAERIGRFDALARKLALAFWPGPLTLVVPLRAGAQIHPLALACLSTVGLRAPKGFGAKLIEKIGRPLAAPSANRSGRVSPTTAAAALAELRGRVPLVVDGGAAAVGLESTIVRVEDGRLRLLRPGGVPAEAIEAAAGIKLERGQEGRIEAPGMMASHYAPDAKLRLDVTEVLAGEVLLAFGLERARGSSRAKTVLNLSPAGDLAEAARNLFGFLKRLDATGADVIAVEPVPGHGLGEAINDRLRRAAAPRENPA